MKQKTIKSDFTLSSVGLHTGLHAKYFSYKGRILDDLRTEAEKEEPTR